MASGQTLWDQLIAGAGDAVADIREKLVEEPWYGRALDAPMSDHAPGEREIGPPVGKELDQHPEQEPGIDR